MEVKLLAPARIELEKAKEYYENRRKGFGDEFSKQVRLAISRIEKHPHSWSNLSVNTRRCRLSRFPYGIIYTVRENEILVLAIAHARRKPNYWRTRQDET